MSTLVRLMTLILFVGIVFTITSPASFAKDEKQTAYERVMKTQTIRCSYLVYSPYLIKDANTGKLSGIFYDLTEELAKNAGLKVEWTEEVGYEDIFTGLKSNRYDAFCSGLWPNASRALVGTFTAPIFYSTVTAWVRADEKRFKNTSDINAPTTQIATIDGVLEDIVAKTDFPNAQRVSSPSTTPFSTNFLKITTKKADITFAEPSGAKEYLELNPKTLKQLPIPPIRVFENTFVLKKGDVELKEVFDIGTKELLYSGRVEAILQKYEKYPNSFMRVAKPYEIRK